MLLEELRALLDARKQISRELEQTQDLISGARAASRDTMMARINEFQAAGLRVSIAFGSGKDRGTVIEYMRDRGFLSGPTFGQYKKNQLAERCCAMVRPTQIARAILDKDISPLASEGMAVDSDGALLRKEAEQLMNHFHPFSADPDADVDVVDQDKLLRVLGLEEQRWDDELRILLNDQPVDKLSPGQRSSAMLPIVALSETVPLIIDQPEDNLDNRMVGTVLTKILADLKEHRQIIVATHNPNIVVGGDAEQVIVLEATEARRAKVQLMGSIDVPAIIESVISIMEMRSALAKDVTSVSCKPKTRLYHGAGRSRRSFHQRPVDCRTMLRVSSRVHAKLARWHARLRRSGELCLQGVVRCATLSSARAIGHCSARPACRSRDSRFNGSRAPREHSLSGIL